MLYGFKDKIRFFNVENINWKFRKIIIKKKIKYIIRKEEKENV